jgi:hypothetical protein
LQLHLTPEPATPPKALLLLLLHHVAAVPLPDVCVLACQLQTLVLLLLPLLQTR